MNSDLTLSSLSGEELLSILRQSLAKKKEVREDPIVRPGSASTLIEEEILQPVPFDKDDQQNKGEVVEEEDMLLEVSHEVDDQIIADEDQKENSISEYDQHELKEDGLGFSPDEFLRDVLSHPPSVAEPSASVSDARDAFQIGKISAYLAYDASFKSFHDNLSTRLETLKKDSSDKKGAWQDAKENYRVLREEIDKAIKKMELTALEYKDAEQDKVVLESVLDWITRVKEKSALKSESTVKELGAFGRNIPSCWNDLIGQQAVSFIENYYSSESSCKNISSANDVDKSLQSESKSKEYSNEKMAVLSRLGSKSGKHSVEEICADFNKNSCSSGTNCKRSHLCLNCNGPHPVLSCGPSKATERVLCVQWNVDERKCRDNKCGREHRCIRCLSIGHTVSKCTEPGASKAVVRTYCYVWNASSVNYCYTRACRRTHGCLRCGQKSHGALSCRDNVETYYKDASSSSSSQKRSRSYDRDQHRDVRGRIDTERK